MPEPILTVFTQGALTWDQHQRTTLGLSVRLSGPPVLPQGDDYEGACPCPCPAVQCCEPGPPFAKLAERCSDGGEDQGAEKRYGAKRELCSVIFGSRLPCERLSFQRESQ